MSRGATGKLRHTLSMITSDIQQMRVSSGTSSPLESHTELVTGKLSNGLSYMILPNRVPAGRFEAHLEILSGSAHELESQQGMAHLLEHVAYMGSPKRQLISGTGSRTNAYTDFHHTVFFAACPVNTPDQFWKKPMMPMAFDALLDVMTTKVDNDRLEKERSAVLSEASMVNKMEYRVECQVLGTLHDENRISKRFPIGKIPLIEKWTKEELQMYHSMHYAPDNVILYVVGDINVKNTVDLIEQKFGHLEVKEDAREIIKFSGEYPETNMQAVSRHFPPVIHEWSCSQSEAEVNVPKALAQMKTDDSALPKPTVFNHELLQSFSFHLFAKRPIEPVVDATSLKRDLMRRIALSALQIRFNVQQRQDPLFTFVDFNQLNWPREGCAVCSLDLTADSSSWRDAVKLAVQEIRRLGIHGLTESELERYKAAILSEAEQAAAQADQMGNEEVLSQLMEAESCGHTFMHPMTRADATGKAISDITLKDVNMIAKELCEHLSHIDPVEGVRPAAIIGCAPMVDRNGKQFSVSQEDILDAIAEALNDPVDPLENTIVPDTLLTPEQLRAKASVCKPEFVPLTGKGSAAGNACSKKMGIVQKQCSNGVRVNLFSMSEEPQRAGIRMYVPGGRMAESREQAGSVLTGSRTIQEGGAFLDMTREEVELFCIDHLVMVDIVASEDALIFDFQTVTTPGPGGKVTGLEACMQVLHIIMTDFKYEPDAFERAKQGFHEHYDSVVKGLESCCQERLAESLLEDDPRFTTPNHAALDALNLEICKNSIVRQLNPNNVEVSIAGDAPMSFLENMALTYLATVPPRPEEEPPVLQDSLNIRTLGKDKQLDVHLSDSDERAMGYLAGPCPNRWGVFADGTTVSEKLSEMNGGKQEERRNNPLFGLVLLSVLQEVANRRLFSVVREERRLTYDASFQFNAPETLKGSWYTVSVTSSPQQVQAAITACKEALGSLRGTFGITSDGVQSAKRTLLNRFRGESLTNKFWCENLSGTQSECIPQKTVQCIADYEAVLGSIQVFDVQQLVGLLDFTDDNMTSVKGVTGSLP
jgi:predicted Zn-dependent peptidase